MLERVWTLDQVAQGLVSWNLDYLQGQRVHRLSGQPLPVLNHSKCEHNLVTPSLNFPCCSLWLRSLGLLHVYLCEEFGPTFSIAPFRQWKTAVRSPVSSLFSRLGKLCSRSITSYIIYPRLPLSVFSTSLFYWTKTTPNWTEHLRLLNRGKLITFSTCCLPFCECSLIALLTLVQLVAH